MKTTAMSESSELPPQGAVTTIPPQGAVVGNNVMEVSLAPGEDPNVALAKARLHPVVNAGHTIRVFEKTLADHPFGSLVTELSRHVENVKAGNMNRPEAMLMMQAHSLDAIFNTLAQKAGANIGTHRDAAETYLRMALKAQAQCRTTLETLAEIKAPRSTQFIKQQNVANQQQVNNGAAAAGAAPSSPAHEKNSAIPPNELLTEAPHATLDTRGAGAASGLDPQLDALVSVDRPENKQRENAQ